MYQTKILLTILTNFSQNVNLAKFCLCFTDAVAAGGLRYPEVLLGGRRCYCGVLLPPPTLPLLPLPHHCLPGRVPVFRIRIHIFWASRIRIRIHLVRDVDPDPSIILLSSSKIVRKP